MDKLSGNENSKIYIINSDYRIVSCNEELKKTFPELECGQICYEALWWRSIPVPLTGRGPEYAVWSWQKRYMRETKACSLI